MYLNSKQLNVIKTFYKTYSIPKMDSRLQVENHKHNLLII